MKIHEKVSRVYELDTGDDHYFTFQEVGVRDQQTGEEHEKEIGFYMQRFVEGDPEMFTSIKLDEAEEMVYELKELIEKIKRERNEKQY